MTTEEIQAQMKDELDTMEKQLKDSEVTNRVLCDKIRDLEAAIETKDQRISDLEETIVGKGVENIRRDNHELESELRKFDKYVEKLQKNYTNEHNQRVNYALRIHKALRFMTDAINYLNGSVSPETGKGE